MKTRNRVAGVALAVMAGVAIMTGDASAATRYSFRSYTNGVFRAGVNIGDHTYVCIKKEEKSDGKWKQKGDDRCYSKTGRSSDGSKLDDADGTTSSSGDKDSAKCTQSREACAMHDTNGNRRGYCHQESNQMLHAVSETVHKARGYWWTSGLHGTYGRNWKACHDECY